MTVGICWVTMMMMVMRMRMRMRMMVRMSWRRGRVRMSMTWRRGRVMAISPQVISTPRPLHTRLQ